MEQHVEEVHRWEHWPSVAVSDILARKLLTALPKASTAQVDALIHEWLRARDEDPLQGGPNLWCLSQVLTRWATHDEAKGENKAFRNWERHERIAELFESKLWQEIERAGA